MSKLGTYVVRVSGLAEGDHDFSFVLDRKFFASFEHSEIKEGIVNAGIILEKIQGALALHFTLNGEVEVVCDRCLEPFMTGIDVHQTIFVRMGETRGEIKDDVIMIAKDDHEIEVGQLMYEFIILALPYQRFHPTGREGMPGCDPEMLSKLEAHRAGQEQKDQADPRWEALKGIIENNN